MRLRGLSEFIFSTRLSGEISSIGSSSTETHFLTGKDEIVFGFQNFGLIYGPNWATRHEPTMYELKVGPVKSIDIVGGLHYKRPRSYLLPQL